MAIAASSTSTTICGPCCESETALLSATVRRPTSLRLHRGAALSLMPEHRASPELCGVVSAISAPLASGHKSIFYLSTYRTDFCLVLADELELVQTILIADGFQVVPTHS